MFMRAMIGAFTALCCFLAAVAACAADQEVEARLEAMQERMNQLEARLEATTDQLAVANQRLGEQNSLLEKAARTGPSSGVAAFLDSLEIGALTIEADW